MKIFVLVLSVIFMIIFFISFIVCFVSKQNGKEERAHIAVLVAGLSFAIAVLPMIIPRVLSHMPSSCPACGAMYHPQKDHYCEECGYALNEGKFECECGTIYYADGGEKFCKNCGTEIVYEE